MFQAALTGAIVSEHHARWWESLPMSVPPRHARRSSTAGCGVRRTIDGRFERPAHGPRDMPVWGWRFYDSRNTNDAEERARVDAVINRLVEYLRSIQKTAG